MTRTVDAPEQRWSHEPLEETLDGARALSVSIADRMTRAGWEALADVAGIPKRRWQRHHPLGPGARLIAIVDDRPAFDTAAWERFVSLVPGAVALPTRTAAAHGIARAALRPPGRAPMRLTDLLRARRVRARMRRAERSLEAEHARHRAAVQRAVDAALAPGDDGSPIATLPTYALAARLELLLAAGEPWTLPAMVDLASARATMHLLRVLTERGSTPEHAFERIVELQVGAGVSSLSYLESLAAMSADDHEDDRAALDAWCDSADGWHASRDLLVESPPLRDDLPAAIRVAVTHVAAISVSRSPDVTVIDGDDELCVAATRARRLTGLRERVARDRATHVAGVRALCWSLARSLDATDALEVPDDAFDLDVDELVRLARGGELHPSTIEAAPTIAPAVASSPDDRHLVRGIAASRGSAQGRIVVLDDPTLDAYVDDAILVCRVTDPAWLPLMVRCAGLVTERGGPLSHAAIVARELALPAVVGASGALAAAAGASTAAVDGTKGIVTFDSTP